MNRFHRKDTTLSIVLFAIIFLFISCGSDEVTQDNSTDGSSDNPVEDPAPSFADINFSNWKVTLPVDENNDGKPDEYKPKDLMDFGYQSLNSVKPFMYDDTDDMSLVFYTYQGGATTANSNYPRTELRELIVPDNSKINWTLKDGGELKGKLKVTEVSVDNDTNNDYHYVIVMQIHGIISVQDMQTHGFSSNNGPPLIKIYWKDGYVWSHKKSLVNESTEGDDLLSTSSSIWSDIKVNLGYVGYESFDFRITASDAKIEVQLNTNEPYVYEDVSLEKWPFENYFKAGNYLTTLDPNAYSYVKYYNLEVTH
ncbi:Poly(Beta-D-mannuronate) lyase [Tenacibaculum sp. 190524A05c]|uniref:polysaccharide lyase family 7 protein n=1 Tax=Tenacibaculum platacis TaxID=3137852 RepID=UPI0031FB0E75